MNAISTQDNATDVRAKLESAIGKAKDACDRLQEKTAAAAKTADNAVRSHPYPAIGIAFGLGVLVGALAIWRRRE